MMQPPRRLPPPWPVEELEAAFKVTDANGVALADVYWSNDPSAVGQWLTKDEARRVAANIAKLPGLLGAG
jgi:hypothetical protein